jgi:hypothetical protein
MYRRQPASAERNAEQTWLPILGCHYCRANEAKMRSQCVKCRRQCTDRIARDSGCQVGFGKYFLDLSSVLFHSASVSAVAPMNSLVNIDAVFGSAVAPI